MSPSSPPTPPVNPWAPPDPRQPPPRPAASPQPYSSADYLLPPHWQQDYPAYPYTQGRTNTLAVVSLVCAICFFFVVTPFVAVVTGHLARRQIRQRGEQGGGLATAGLIVGYIFAALFALGIVATLVGATGEGLSNKAKMRHDLRHIAAAEEAHRIDFRSYTTDSTALALDGFTRRHNDQSLLLVGVDGARDYCIVGSPHGSSAWYLYDSVYPGFVPGEFGSAEAAESKCVDDAIRTYAPVVSAGSTATSNASGPIDARPR